MHVILRWALSLLLMVTAHFGVAAQTATPLFKAGAAAVDITPTRLPIRVAGSIQERYADRINDPLHARSLVFEMGANRLAISIVDNCLIPRDLLDAAKEIAHRDTGIPVEHMLVAATHTHSAPVVVGVHGNDPVPDYQNHLKRGIADSIIQAWQNRMAARVGWGSGRCEEWVHCRRWIMHPGTAFTVHFSGHPTNQAQMNPGHDNSNKIRQTGPVDPEVTVLSVQTADGRPLALLANYSTHYAGAPDISADYFGAFARIVSEQLHAASNDPSFVGILCNGTSGDANCIDFSKPRRSFTHEEVAARVASVALQALSHIDYTTNPELAMLETKLPLQVRMPTPEETKAARAWLHTNMPDGVVRSWEQNYARETVLLSQLPPARILKLQALRVGDLAITAIPCEVYGSTGLSLKNTSPFRTTMNISMANGAEGYLPPPEQHALGGYTTWRARSSCLEVNAEPKIIAALTTLLRQIATTP